MEEVNKKLFEMQGPGFSKDPGAAFLAIWCLQAGTDFPINSASSTARLSPAQWYPTLQKTSVRKNLSHKLSPVNHRSAY